MVKYCNIFYLFIELLCEKYLVCLGPKDKYSMLTIWGKICVSSLTTLSELLANEIFKCLLEGQKFKAHNGNILCDTHVTFYAFFNRRGEESCRSDISKQEDCRGLVNYILFLIFLVHADQMLKINETIILLCKSHSASAIWHRVCPEWHHMSLMLQNLTKTHVTRDISAHNIVIKNTLQKKDNFERQVSIPTKVSF